VIDGVVRWRPASRSGLEHLVLAGTGDGGLAAESVVIGTADDGARYAAGYRILCDAGWRARRVEVAMIGTERAVALAADGAGRWTDTATGAHLPALDGALEPDLEASPFTNTLPIRRLGLARGASAEIAVAYVSFPGLAVSAERQRYTCLEPGRLYRFESLDGGGFVRDLETDPDGLVLAYPGLFERVP
jgi:uncharacterized protein